MNAELGPRLALLARKSRERGNDTSIFSADRADGLPSERAEGWAGFVSSVATSESIEGTLIEPLFQAFGGHAEARDYLDTHAADERYHYDLFIRYLKGTFDYEKKKRTATDAVIYDTILPRIAAMGVKKPLYILAILHFYETFSIRFYRTIRERADSAGLSQLSSIFGLVEKDELRHVAGVEALTHLAHERDGKPGLADRVAIRSVVELVRMDIHTGRAAIHNKRVRRNGQRIGLDLEEMNREAARVAALTCAFVGGTA